MLRAALVVGAAESRSETDQVGIGLDRVGLLEPLQGFARRLEEASVDTVYANNVLEHVPDLPRLMGNCLKLLKTGGQFVIEVPNEHAQTAWQDPTHLRALNEQSWIYYADWFWYLGWFEHRFHVEQSAYLDIDLRECTRDKAAFMRVCLRKVETSLRERTTARTMAATLELPDDAAPLIHMPQREPLALRA